MSSASLMTIRSPGFAMATDGAKQAGQGGLASAGISPDVRDCRAVASQVDAVAPHGPQACDPIYCKQGPGVQHWLAHAAAFGPAGTPGSAAA
jgi:hypothetical protein